MEDAPTETAGTLFCLCNRKLAYNSDQKRMQELLNYLPAPLYQDVVHVRRDIQRLEGLIATDINLNTEKNKRLPEQCFILNPETHQLDFEKTALRTEQFISRVEFFALCSKLALDKPTERVYQKMSEKEQEKLEDANEPVVWCRALELSPRRAILHYDDIALNCASEGYLPALERSLMKVREGVDTTALLQRCVINAILHGHYHIANMIRCENYACAFHYFFPDGRVTAEFFAQLLDREKLKPEVGEQIASDLLDWLTKHDIQRLRRSIENDKRVPPGVLRRFESMYRECIDQRDYACTEYD